MKRFLLAGAFSVVFITPAFAHACIIMDTVNHQSPCEVWEGEYCQKPPYPNYQVMGSYASRWEAENVLLSMTVCKRDVYIVWDLVTGVCQIRPPTHWEPTASGNFLDHGEDNDRYNVLGQYGSVDEAKKAASTLGQCKHEPHYQP